MTVSVSVVICAYTEKRLDALGAAVRSVQTQTVAPHELVVVVDHNRALFERLQGQLGDALVIENAHRQGLAGARNTGIEATTGDVVAFLDDDAAADSRWLEALVAAYGQSGDVLGVGGHIEPAWPADERPGWFPAEFDWVVGCTYRGSPADRAEIRNLIGANMSVRREAFERAGGFAEGMGRIGTKPLGCEETELCIRARARCAGGTFLYEPAAKVRHTVAPERATWRYFLSRCWSEGISKAWVARLAGATDGLSSERAHAARALPLGVLRGLGDLVRGDAAGGLRALAIVLGLATTVAGYLRGVAGRSAAEPVPVPVIEKGTTPHAEGA